MGFLFCIALLATNVATVFSWPPVVFTGKIELLLSCSLKTDTSETGRFLLA